MPHGLRDWRDSRHGAGNGFGFGNALSIAVSVLLAFVFRRTSEDSFWVKSSTGTGNLALDWKPRPGNWRAILMNADGTRGVSAAMQFGARTSLLKGGGIALLAAAALAAALGAALARRARA